MRGKLMFLGGLAVGYVLGTRDGRERYEKLVKNARTIMEHPTVQEARGVVQAEASRLYAEGKHLVTEKLGHARHDADTRHDADARHDAAVAHADVVHKGVAHKGVAHADDADVAAASRRPI